ncbi:MAG: amidohydrolase [Atopobiaceae bacterium]|nr:amidohydrolase [Atopobiaceae bacterium]
MGTLISNTLAILPAGNGHAAGRHDLYIEGTDTVGIDEAPAGFVANETIDGTQRLTIPGLINAHTHTYMSMMRNVADDLSFADWLFGTIEPIEDQLEPKDSYWASLLSQAEMIRSGTTCFNDQQMHIGQTTGAVVESGMRAVICRGLVGGERDLNERRIREALQERDAFADCDRLTFRLGPHAPYSCGPGYLRGVAEVAKREGMGIHIHIAESQTETDNMWAEHHCTPVEYVRDAGIFEVPTIAAHCIRVNESDRAILAENGVSVVTNPASNMKLGNGFAPVPELVAAGINVCVGTDGAASNNAQNMFRELGLLALIHKGTHDTPQCISADEVLKMATRNAAAALGLPTGSLEVGKRADLALLDLNAPSLTPLNNAVAALSYSANGSEVDTVIINGKTVMRNRELLTIDEERVRHEIARICKRLGLAQGI